MHVEQLPSVEEVVSSLEAGRQRLSDADLVGASRSALTSARDALPRGWPRRGRPRRWPWVAGIILGTTMLGWAILSNAALRARLARSARAIRERIAALRSNRYDRLEIDRDDPIAFPAAETAPIEASSFTASTTTDATGYPAGLGSNSGDGIPALKETGSPA